MSDDEIRPDAPNPVVLYVLGSVVLGFATAASVVVYLIGLLS